MDACGVDTKVLSVNVARSGVQNMQISGKGSGSSPTQGSFAGGFTQPALDVGATCIDCYFESIIVTGGSRPIQSAGTDSRWNNVYATWGYGDSLVYLYNSNAQRFFDGTFDQLWPNFTIPTTVCSAWASAHAYLAGDCASTGGYVIQYITGGTSGGVAPTLANYSNNITDGTAVAQLAYKSGLALMRLDSLASEMLATKLDLSGASDYGLALTNTLGTGGPSFNHFSQLVISAQNLYNVYLHDGNRFTLTDSHFGGCIDVAGGCAALLTTTNWVDGASVANSFIAGAGNCIFNTAGTNLHLSNNYISTCTIGYFATANISNWSIKGGKISATTAIALAAGTGNNYFIDTDVSGSGTPISNSATGTNRYIDFGNSATSGGIPYFDANGVVQSSAALTANRLVLGGGAATAPTVLGSLGTTGSALMGNASGAPSFNAAPSFGTSVTAPFVNATATGSSYRINNTKIIDSGGGAEYLIFYGVSSGHQIFLGGSSSDKTSYYGNDTHTFRDFATTTNFVNINATKLALVMTTDATSTSTGAFTNPGGMSVNKRVWMNGLTTTTATQTAYLCQASTGEIVADTSAVNLCVASSRRFKEDLTPVADEDALDKVLRLRPNVGHYKPEGIFTADKGWTRDHVWLVAEDVADVDERLISRDAEGRVYSVDYTGVFTLYAGAIRALRAENDNLQLRIERLERKQQ